MSIVLYNASKLAIFLEKRKPKLVFSFFISKKFGFVTVDPLLQIKNPALGDFLIPKIWLRLKSFACQFHQHKPLIILNNVVII